MLLHFNTTTRLHFHAAFCSFNYEASCAASQAFKQSLEQFNCLTCRTIV